jgi:hypothetical protein
MRVSSTPLPPFYYVDNFVKVLQALQVRDHDLFNEFEADFIRAFFHLPIGAQALTVRMALRSAPYYRGRSLEYPELPEPRKHLEVLKSAGWVTDDPMVDFQELIDVLPSTWLVEGLGLRSRPSVNKVRMKAQAREIYPNPLPLSASHFRLADGLYRFLHAGLCARLCAMYFGNRDQDWSEYLLADLGVRRYERVRIVCASRPFETRADVDAFHALHECETNLARAKAVELLERLPAAPLGCDWLLEWHRQVSLKIARQMERQGELLPALMMYRRLGTLEAEERDGILTRKLGGEAGMRFNHRSVPHFDLAIAERGRSRIEYLVAQQLLLEEPGSEVLYAENRLINSLFGLLLWRAIFAPVRGAFFHEYHTAPVDLYSPHFRKRRTQQVDACLAELDTGAYPRTIRMNFHEKARLLNPFVAWGWLRLPVLELALNTIPARHLRTLFEWMLLDLKRNTVGFPDLIQFWPTSGAYRMIEVKLGTDRLQPNQRRFLQHVQGQGIPVSVCYVSTASRPPRLRVSSTPARTVGDSLDLFPEA